MKLGVFIPGRMMSERLPGKLILPIGDSCLWEIACRKLSALPDRYGKYALCYDEPLVEIAGRTPGIQMIFRSPETTRVDGPLNFIFKDLENLPETHIMFLNPCLAFLTEDTIKNALIEFEAGNMNYATSVKPLKNWLFQQDGSNINPVDYCRLSTKEIPPIYQAAHCFHIFNRAQFFKDGMMLKPGHGILEIPDDETIDVDTSLDYEFARWYYERLKE